MDLAVRLVVLTSLLVVASSLEDVVSHRRARRSPILGLLRRYPSNDDDAPPPHHLFGPIHGILDHAKRFLPKIKIIINPTHQKPGSAPEEEKSTPESEEYPAPEWNETDTPPEEDNQQWEDLIQPRLHRPRRFVESKVFRVPLQFLSNARPFHVKINHDQLELPGPV